MASWVTPVTRATGDVLSVTDFNTLSGDAIFLYQAPYALAYPSTNTSITNGPVTPITLDTLSGGYGYSVSGGNLLAPLTGVYLISISAFINGGFTNTGNFTSIMKLNGTQVLSGTQVPGNAEGTPQSNGCSVLKASASDTFGLYAQQNSGSTLTIGGASSGATFLSSFFIGSQ